MAATQGHLDALSPVAHARGSSPMDENCVVFMKVGDDHDANCSPKGKNWTSTTAILAVPMMASAIQKHSHLKIWRGQLWGRTDLWFVWSHVKKQLFHSLEPVRLIMRRDPHPVLDSFIAICTFRVLEVQCAVGTGQAAQNIVDQYPEKGYPMHSLIVVSRQKPEDTSAEGFTDAWNLAVR